MKIILSVIRPEKFRDVKESLNKEGVGIMTVFDVRGCGQQKGFVEEFRGLEKEIHLHRKVAILIGVNESFVEKTVKAIIKGARTNGGKIGDGKIFILPLEECIRIRTGEMSVAAIGGKSKELESSGKTKIINIS